MSEDIRSVVKRLLVTPAESEALRAESKRSNRSEAELIRRGFLSRALSVSTPKTKSKACSICGCDNKAAGHHHEKTCPRFKVGKA